MGTDSSSHTWLITTGDPAGSSPELLPGILAEQQPDEQFIFVGPPAVKERLNLSISTEKEPPTGRKNIWYPTTKYPANQVLSGSPNQQSGHSAFEALKTGLELTEKYEIDGLLTLPLSKAAVRRQAQPEFTGHTEYLESFWNKNAVMSFFGTQFDVALLTRHLPLKEVSDHLTPQQIISQVHSLAKFYRNHGKSDPTFGLLGLNPHAGESGMIGTEEKELLKPAINQLHADGIKINGPFPADSFLPVKADSVDMVISCYHDQGLTPFKLLHFYTGVHASLGLPLLRVSPDHGIAADLAGQNKIDPRSTVNCLNWLRKWGQKETVN